MYVITFYSFKGGVGRTQALVNVGAVLAKQNKKVLLVDFDLEAPGLDSVEGLQIDKKCPGVVDFITDYRQSKGVVPELSGYISHAVVRAASTPKKNLVKLDVMLAGAPNDYRRRLVEIDWASLYKEEEGGQLFEDLRSQWKSEAYDYVLIDSRTGFTDVAGICTMQLPDCVALVMQPNQANENGILKVYETLSQQAYKRDMFIVVGNIPSSDDEEGVLEPGLIRLKNYCNLDMYPVYRTDSLYLLDSAVVTVTRPNSRMAQEYEEIAARAINKNVLDANVGILWIYSIKFGYTSLHSSFLLDFSNSTAAKSRFIKSFRNFSSWGGSGKKRKLNIDDARRIYNSIISLHENNISPTLIQKKLLFKAGLLVQPYYDFESGQIDEWMHPDGDFQIREWSGVCLDNNEPMTPMIVHWRPQEINKGIGFINLSINQNSTNAETDIVGAEWAYQYSQSDLEARIKSLECLKGILSKFLVDDGEVVRVVNLLGVIKPKLLTNLLLLPELNSSPRTKSRSSVGASRQLCDFINMNFLSSVGNVLLRSSEGRDLIIKLWSVRASSNSWLLAKENISTLRVISRACLLSNNNDFFNEIKDCLNKVILFDQMIYSGKSQFEYLVSWARKVGTVGMNSVANEFYNKFHKDIPWTNVQLDEISLDPQYGAPVEAFPGYMNCQRPESALALDVAQLMLADRIEDAINLGSQLLEHWRDGIRYKFPMTLRGLEKPKRVLEWYPMSLLTLEPIPLQELKREVEYLVECAQSGNEVQWGKRRV